MAKQTELGLKGAGVEGIKIAALTKALNEYRDARNDLVAARTAINSAKPKALAIFHANEEKLKGDDGILRYRHDDQIVKVITSKERLKFEDADETDEEESETEL